MKSYNVKDFSLKYTIESGQFFLFEKSNEYYYIIHGNQLIKVRQEGDTLFYTGITEEELKYFFNLDMDLKEATKDFKDKYIIHALNEYWGLRLLNQDLWQSIIGFVCSSCSNIPKIKMNLQLVSKSFGNKIEFEEKTYYTFPEIGKLDDINKLIKAKTGYRAKYIFDINKIISNTDFLEKLKSLDYKNARKMLMTLPGIGSKVADCICLYGLKHYDAFPIDTWIKQTLEKLYHNNEKKSIKEHEKFINKYFEVNKGLQQQYLFYWAKNNLKSMTKT